MGVKSLTSWKGLLFSLERLPDRAMVEPESLPQDGGDAGRLESWREKLCGFYAVLPGPDEALARALLASCDRGGAGATVLQVRYKPAGSVSTAALVDAARLARRATRRAGALLIVDDRLDVALAVGADGVHLGQTDLPIADARRVVQHATPGRRFLIGISTHDTEQVVAAVRAGADYLGFGPVYATSTKENPDPVRGLDGLAAAVELAGGVPVVAIGGIGPRRAADVAATGAAAACAIGSVNGAADPAAAGRRIGAAFGRGSSE